MKFFKENKTFEEILLEFLELRRISLSEATYRGYVGYCGLFNSWLKIHNYEKLSLRKLNPDIIAKFFLYLAVDRDLDKATCEKYYQDLKIIFKYAQKRNLIETLPFDLVTFPAKKVDRGSKVILEDDLILLLSTIRDTQFQLYVACMFQYYCFLRPGGELRLLRIGDVDLNMGVIRVPMLRDKVRQQEVVTMPVQLIELCKEYEIEGKDKHWFVFGKHHVPGPIPWSINMLSYQFRIIRRQLGLPEEYKFYSMKHTGATRLHESGASMRTCMDQLRHRRLASTQHYIQRHGGVVNNTIRLNFPEPQLIERKIFRRKPKSVA